VKLDKQDTVRNANLSRAAYHCKGKDWQQIIEPFKDKKMSVLEFAHKLGVEKK